MSAHDDEALAFTVATVWREERVSCPHPDLVHACSLPDSAFCCVCSVGLR